MSNVKQAKYRLSLSLQELEYLHHRLNTNEPVQVENLGTDKLLRAKVHIAIVKASEGLVKPAFESSPKLSTSEKLGSPLSANERRRLAYESGEPSEAATQYRYDNNLMGEAEARQYELDMFNQEN